IFIALIPLFYLEESIRNDDQKRKGFRLFGYSYLTFLIWNLITTWWLINSTVFGMLFANLCNSLFYALLFTCFFWAKGRLPYRSSYWFLISIWLTFEKIHLLWDFSWSWLNLGNVFSEKIYWIQWYEYTGTFGGSFWVLSLNVWLFFILKSYSQTRSFKSLFRKITYPLLSIALPIAVSLYLYQRVETPKKSIEVIMVQPNIDPYDEKYRLSNSVLAKQLFEQIQPYISTSTDYILAPETYFAEGYGEELKNFPQTTLHQKIQQELADYPKTQLITGIQFYDVFVQNEAPSLTANLARKGLWIEYYNSALAESKKDNPVYYHKSKLVVGVENMPFKSILNPLLGDVMLDLGGTVASRVTQENRSTFTHPILQEKAAPIICWESIFGEFVTGYIKEGATFLAVLSNDAWWGETPGHRQLLSYTRLRA
ncbi:MAG: apolipoprotein N-acyltransferase, partial [Flavobacteriaceae bacterium]